MNVGSLFSGVGGIDLGLERAGHRVVFQCEQDPYCRRVLARHWPGVPCAGDVREVDADWVERLEPVSGSRPDARSGGGEAGRIQLLCGGFPCQDLSVAGKRRGLAGERSSLVFEFARIADELVGSGGWILVENVPGLLSGCSCIGCGQCRELLRLHSRGWAALGRSTGRDDRGRLFARSEADGADGAKRSGRCPCGRCAEARRLLDEHDGTEFSVVRGLFGEIGFHDFAWRVLDSRYFGVPQRRRRVFILARRARGRRAAEVLLEPESGGGDFEASEEAQARVAGSLSHGSASSGVSAPGRRQEDDENIVSALDRKGGGADDNDAQAGHLVAPALTRRYGKGTDSDASDALVADTLRSHPRPGSATPGAIVAHTLRAEGFDASEDGTERGTPLVTDRVRAPSGLPGRVDDSVNLFVENSRDEVREMPISPSLNGGSHPTRLAPFITGSGQALDRSAFDPLPDGPRYAACGNAVTRNVAEWVGHRLPMEVEPVEEIGEMEQ